MGVAMHAADCHFFLVTPIYSRYPMWWFAPFWSGSGYSSEVRPSARAMCQKRGMPATCSVLMREHQCPGAIRSTQHPEHASCNTLQAINFALSALRSGALRAQDIWLSHHGFVALGLTEVALRRSISTNEGLGGSRRGFSCCPASRPRTVHVCDAGTRRGRLFARAWTQMMPGALLGVVHCQE